VYAGGVVNIHEHDHRTGNLRRNTMQFGVHLPSFWNDYGTSNVRTAVEETARAAEALGYVSVWANDRVIASSDEPFAEHGLIEPFITLASLIHLVPRLHLGLGVLVLPQRNAIIVAKQAAALDLLSQGRFILGVGIGHRKAAFQILGADFAHRAAITDESIKLLRALWREPRVSVQGPTYTLTDAIFEPKPSRGEVPIWIGGNSAPAARRTAQLGDGWLAWNISLDEFHAGVATIKTSAVGGRRPVIAVEFWFRIDDVGKQTPVHDPFLAQIVHFPGTPEMIVEQLTPYRQAGLEYVLCGFAADSVDNMLHQMQVFAEQVMPHFADAEG
jgi:probable F420-dependent oxidoreductase